MFGWATLDQFAGFALGERDVCRGPSGRRELAATPPVIRKDAGASRSPSATSVGAVVETGAAAQSPTAPTCHWCGSTIAILEYVVKGQKIHACVNIRACGERVRRQRQQQAAATRRSLDAPTMWGKVA